MALTVVLFGCRATKKVTELKSENSDKTEVNQKTDVKEETKVNNDLSTYKKTTITETVFDTDVKPNNDTSPENSTTVQNEPKSVVKAIKVTVIEEGTKDNSKIITNKTDNSKTTVKEEEKGKVETMEIEKKSVPIKWGWIFGCVLIGLILFVYVSNYKIAVIIKAFIKRLVP